MDRSRLLFVALIAGPKRRCRRQPSERQRPKDLWVMSMANQGWFNTLE